MSVRGRIVVGRDSPVPGHINCPAFGPVSVFATPQTLTSADNGAEEGENSPCTQHTSIAEGTSLTDRGSEVCGVHIADSPQTPPSNVDRHSPNTMSQMRLNAICTVPIPRGRWTHPTLESYAVAAHVLVVL